MSAQAERKDARSGNAKADSGNEVRPSSASPSLPARNATRKPARLRAHAPPETPRGCGGGDAPEGAAPSFPKVDKKASNLSIAACDGQIQLFSCNNRAIRCSKRHIMRRRSVKTGRFSPSWTNSSRICPKVRKSAGISFATQDRAIEVRTQERKRRRRSRGAQGARGRGIRGQRAREEEGSPGAPRAREREAGAGRARRGVCGRGTREQEPKEQDGRGQEPRAGAEADRGRTSEAGRPARQEAGSAQQNARCQDRSPDNGRLALESAFNRAKGATLTFHQALDQHLAQLLGLAIALQLLHALAEQRVDGLLVSRRDSRWRPSRFPPRWHE